MHHISKPILLSTTSTDFQVDCRVEAWRGSSFHTFGVQLMVGGVAGSENVLVNPSTSSSEPAPDDPDNAVIFHYAWVGLAATNHLRIRMNGHTTNRLTCFHVARRFHIDPT